jgi:hypothetical protein
MELDGADQIENFGSDFGCRNDLPKTEIKLEDSENQPIVTLETKTNISKTIVGIKNDKVTGDITVDVNQEFIKRPVW